MEDAIRNEKLDFSKIPSDTPAVYKRNPSGRSLQEIQRLRSEFKKRTEGAKRSAQFEFTPPNYDAEYADAISKLDDSAR